MGIHAAHRRRCSAASRAWCRGSRRPWSWKSFDFYIEAEYVFDRQDSDANYAYAWSELGWTTVEWLRVGIVGQRTRVVDNDRDLQRGVLLQVFAGKATISAYASNPDNSNRYATVALGFDF